MARVRVPPKLQLWIDARKRYRLSHAQVQMARELGMNPKSLGKLANHDQEPWKAPLPQFIEHLYLKRFGRERPEQIFSIEERVRLEQTRKAERRARRGAELTTEMAVVCPTEPDRNGEPHHPGKEMLDGTC